MTKRPKRSPNKALNRRNFLATTGLAITTMPTVAAVSSEDTEDLTFHEKIKKADKILREEGKKARSDYLESQDIPSTVTRGKFASSRMEEQESGGISPDKVDCVEPTQCDGDIDLAMSINLNYDRDCYYTHVSVGIRYINYEGPFGGAYKGGEKPVDGLGFHWPEEEWEVEDQYDIPSSTNGDTNIEWDNGSWTPEGLAFKVDDREMCTDVTGQSPEWSDYESAGVYMNKGDDWESDSAIHATYLHTWNGIATGFSVGYPPSISLSASSTAESEDLQTTLTGQTLMVTTSDMPPI